MTTSTRPMPYRGEHYAGDPRPAQTTAAPTRFLVVVDDPAEDVARILGMDEDDFRSDIAQAYRDEDILCVVSTQELAHLLEAGITIRRPRIGVDYDADSVSVRVRRDGVLTLRM